MYILKWKDGVDCEQQFQYKPELTRRICAMIDKDVLTTFEVVEHKITAESKVSDADIEKAIFDLDWHIDTAMGLSTLNLADVLAIQCRIGKMQLMVDAMLTEINDPRMVTK